jgi:hypothetical protein
LVAEGAFHIHTIFVPDFVIQIRSREGWPVLDDFEAMSASAPINKLTKKAGRLPSLLEDWVNNRLRPHYAWADKRGDMYADAYRSAYVLTYLLSATAVFMALLPMAANLEGIGETVCVAIEFVILLTIVLLLVFGRWRHWHERWMEYRLLAELIRQIRFLIPLGGGRPFPRAPIHHGVYENLNQTWMYWHMRAIGRAAGIPPAKVTPDYVHDCLRYVAEIVNGSDGQLKFHRDTETRSNEIGHRLHVTATLLFVLTIVSIAIHLALGLSSSASIPPWLPTYFLTLHHAAIDRWLVLTAATFPALGAALSGIANQGEFARLAKRSAAMGDAFEQFAGLIEELQSRDDQKRPPLKLSQVVLLASKIAEIMVDEVADWRVVVVEQPTHAA